MHRQFSFISLSFYALNHFGRLRRRFQRTTTEKDSADSDKIRRDFDNHIETGFQFATFQGPLCAEPVEGMVYFIEQVDIDRDALGKEIGELVDLITLTISSLSCTRAKQAVPSNWVSNISCSGCM